MRWLVKFYKLIKRLKTRLHLPSLDRLFLYAAAIALLVLSGYQLLSPLKAFEYQVANLFSSKHSVDSRVVMVAIDEASIRAKGPWPWSRSELVSMMYQLRRANPRIVGLQLDLSTARNQEALENLKQLDELGIDRALARYSSSMRSKYRKWYSDTHRLLNADANLAAQMSRSGDVVLPIYDVIGGVAEQKAVANNEVSVNYGPEGWLAYLPAWLKATRPPQIKSLLLPTEVFQNSAAGLGVFTLQQSELGLPLVYNYKGRYLPSYILRLIAQEKRVRPSRILLGENGDVAVANFSIHTDSSFVTYPLFYTSSGDDGAVPVFSAADLNKSQIRRQLRGKIVIVGVTHPAWAQYKRTPTGALLPLPEYTAQQVSAVLQGDVLSVPRDNGWWEQLAIVLALAYMLFIYRRFSHRTAVNMTFSLIGLLIVTEWFLMVIQGLWLPLVAPALMLVLGLLVFEGKGLYTHLKFLWGRSGEFDETSRRLGLALRAQGQLDSAFSALRKCSNSNASLEALYDLALEYERKRNFHKAVQVYQHLQQMRHGFKDVGERLNRTRDMANTIVIGSGGGGTNEGTIVMSGDAIQKPTLGRYQIESILGRGAMGTVYLGRDPHIDRVVAIKTINLGGDFDESQIKEAKERFFREAKAAGRLNHPNIVTIFDMGEEDDLAYIAMDYLDGVNLAAYTNPDHLLKVKEVLEIGAEVAESLDYAHKHGVVHRDIKPANIIYDRKKHSAKVTDFGIASLTDATQTKTGIILGTPSYMSPEQIAGKKIDGRSDLFSLGVTLFQLLTGMLPFEGDSMAALMFKITNEKQQSVRRLRSNLPACTGTIINKALQKDVESRYSTGAEMAKDLRKCLEKA